MATTEILPQGIDIGDAVERMLSPELTGKKEEEETTEETLEETSTEEDEDTHSEETDDDEETSDEESEESEDTETGDDDDDDDSEDETAELYTVKVDGEEMQVDLNELKRGYSGQQYVQKKMRDAAEIRETAEKAFENLQSERQRVAQILQFVESGQITSPPTEPDKAMFESDPLGYMEAKIEYDENIGRYNQRMAAVRRTLGEQQAADQQAMQAYITEQAMQLQAVEPDFADATKAAAIRESMVKVGANVYGYTAEEIAGITDHRAIRVLRDAARWNELQGKTAETKKRVSKAVASKGRHKKRTTTAEVRKTKQRDKLRQTGRIEDAVDLMLQ